MPIDKEQRKKYPINWVLIAAKIKWERAQNHCEVCGVEGGSINIKSGKKIILGVAHLNHIESDNRELNLMCMCGSCHLKYDKVDNWKRRKRNKYKSNPNQLTIQ